MITKEDIYKFLEYKYDCSFDVFIEHVTLCKQYNGIEVAAYEIIKLLKEISEESNKYILKSIQLTNRMICCIIKNEE